MNLHRSFDLYVSWFAIAIMLLLPGRHNPLIVVECFETIVWNVLHESSKLHIVSQASDFPVLF